MRHQLITEAVPRLAVHMSWWGTTGIRVDGREPDMEEKFRLIAEAGFDGIDAFVPEPGESAAFWRALLKQYGLALSVNAYPKSLEDMRAALERAAAFGGIRSMNVQVMTPFLTDSPAEAMLAGIADLSGEFGLPCTVETHRGTITQDLLRTAAYVERLPELRLTADFSHYVLAGEMGGIPDEAEQLFNRLLSRTDCMHGRVSNGEQIQADIGPEGSHPMLEHYKRWWTQGMRDWLARPNGGALLFVPELGPPPYAITTDETSGRTKEFSDRWVQSLFLLKLARTLWANVMN